MARPAAKPHVLVLGGNFAGLAGAQHVRDFFLNHGRVPDVGLQRAQFAAEALPL